MTKTFKELREVDMLVGGLYQKNVELSSTKFGYAYKRFIEKNFLPIAKEYNEQIELVRVDNALEDDKTKAILTDPANIRGYKYSKEGLRKVIEQEREVVKQWEIKEVEVTPFISSFTPESLTDEEKEVLTGLVI